MCRFNLTAAELQAVVEPWAREQWVELGERKWSPHQATLTILEGPEIPVQQLSMGRGWRTAQRRGDDVTARVLAAAGTPGTPTADAPGPGASGDLPPLADSLGLELLSALGDQPAPLARAWRLAASRCPQWPASQSLALAEQTVRLLLRGGLIVLLHTTSTGASDGDGGHPGENRRDIEGARMSVGEDELEQVLRSVESWVGEGHAGGVQMRRA
jgi:hypothetical protein